jgi:hypothetical protein
MKISKYSSTLRAGFALALAGLLLPIAAEAQPFEGFGAATVGAGTSGYTTYVVTRDDDPDGNVPGTLRHALRQTGARYVTFDNSLAGKTIMLRERVIIENTSSSNRGNLTVDGSGVISPTDPSVRGVTIYGAEISIKKTSQVIFKELRIRRGRENIDKGPFAVGKGSAQLDTISIDDSSNVVLHKLSLGWSCDEIVGVTRSQNVTISQCIFAEPLGDVVHNPVGKDSAPITPLADQIHPYGADHNYCINASASTLSLIRNVFYNYRTRGPQFEANDVRDAYPETGGQRLVKMEAVNNVMFNYTEAGARYGADVEGGSPANAQFDFQFIGNLFYSHDDDDGIKEIVAAKTTTPSDPTRLRVHVSNNFGPNRMSANPLDSNDERRVVYAKHPTTDALVQVNLASSLYNNQVITTGTTSLSGAPVITVSDKAAFLGTILADVGAYSSHRDATDLRVIETILDEDTSEDLKKSPPELPTPPVIPSVWTSQDVGSPSVTGSSSESGGVHTVSGGGDLKGSDDRFRFVFQEASGDCDIIARVVTLVGSDPDAAAGVMIRDNLNSNCQMAAMLLTNTASSAKARRRTTVSGATSDTTVAVSVPEWVRVNRTGNTFKFYHSGNGTSWTLDQTVTISMGANTYVGLAVASDTSTLATATFDNVVFTP